MEIWGECEEFPENCSTLSPVGANASEDYNLKTFGGQDYILDNVYVRGIFCILYTAVFCLCFFGNILVILVVTLHWKMRSKTKFCLANLAFANLCVGVFCVYQNLSTFLIERWVFGHVMCKMYHFINSLSHTASILILVVTCVERYLTILHPFRSRRWITMTRLRIVIVGMWVLSAVLSSPRLYYITTYHIPVPALEDGVVSYDMICAPVQTRYDVRIVDTTYFVLLFLLPLLVMSGLYTLVAIHLWRENGLYQKIPAELLRSVPKPSSRRMSVQRDRSSEPEESTGARGIYTPKRATRCSSGRKRVIQYLHPSSDAESVERTERCASRNSFRTKRTQSLVAETCLIGDDVTLALGSVSGISTSVGQSMNGNPENVFDSREAVQMKRLKTRQAVLRMMITIVATFAICNMPFHLRKLFTIFTRDSNVLMSNSSFFLTPMTFLLMYANCAINPVIYVFMSSDFRTSVLDLARCETRRTHGSSRGRNSPT